MNTKAYLGLFKYSLDAGDIPQDLYDEVVAKVEAEGKMTKRIYYEYLDELERRRLFDVDGTPFNTDNSAKTDGSYVYKHPKNPIWHIAHGFWSTVFKLLGGYMLGAFGYGVWRVKDRKKLKGIKACVTTSNHVGYVDALLTRRALGMRKQYIVAAPHNCKNDLGGKLLKSATIIPLPSALSGNKPFMEMLEYVRDRGGAIHFYPEKSLWARYNKPRPYKDGAFFYADRLDVPVVPMLYCFHKPKGLRKLLGLAKVTIKIADPIYADKTLPSRDRKSDLARRAEQAVAGLYEEFYGKPLTYLDPIVKDEDQSDAEIPAAAEVQNSVAKTETADAIEQPDTTVAEGTENINSQTEASENTTPETTDMP